MSEEKLVKMEFVIPDGMKDDIAKKLVESTKDVYYWGVAKAISEKVQEKMESDGFCERVADAVLEKIKISEQEFIEGMGNAIKESLIKVSQTLGEEVLNKVNEKIKSYGFIKIGDRF